MSYVTDAAKMQNMKDEYQEYLALMKKAAEIMQRWDKGDETRNNATNMLGDIFDEVERKFTGPHSAPTISHLLRHDYEINDPRITLSFDDFVSARKEYEENDYASLYSK